MNNERSLSFYRLKVAVFLLYALLCVVLGVAWFYTERAYRKVDDYERRMVAFDYLRAVRERLEGVLLRNVQRLRVISSRIAENPDMTQESFARTVQGEFPEDGVLRYISAAPGMVVRYLYPLEGNEADLGVDYRGLASVSKLAEQAIMSKEVIVDGLVDLEPGDKGLVAHIPVFLDGGEKAQEVQLWGLVSAVIDVDKLFSSVDLVNQTNLRLAVRCHPENGRSLPIYGDQHVFERNPVVTIISFPQCAWEVAGIPVGATKERSYWLIRAGFIGAGVVVLIFMVLLFSSMRAPAQALKQIDEIIRTLPGVLFQFHLAPGGDMRFTYIGDRISEMLGMPREELLGDARRVFELIHPNDLTKIKKSIEGSASTLEPRHEAFRVRHPRRGMIWLECNSVPIKRTDGTKVWTVYVADISRLKADERRLFSTLDKSPVAVQWYDEDGKVLYWNKGSERLYGWKAGQALGRALGDLIFDEREAVAFYEITRQARASKEPVGPVEFNAHHRDGRRLIVSSVLFHITGETSPIVVCMDIDITDQKKRENDLTLAREEAERANRKKTSFLANMSHELRTPLNSIIGFSQLLEDRSLLNDEEYREVVSHISSSGRYLLNLLEDVLDISRIEAGKVNLRRRPTELLPLVEDAVKIAHPNVERNKTVLSTDDLGGIWVYGDDKAIRQVLVNLISNARKYSPVNTTIRIAGYVNGNYVRVSVIDEGPGIDPQCMNRIFEPFERLQNSDSPEKGVGIGLSIAKQLVEKMGGRIGVDSSPGAGSEFWFELKEARLEHKGRDGPDRDYAEYRKLLKGFDGLDGEVLYVEDDQSSSLLMDYIFQMLPGVDLHHADTGARGLELLSDIKPDLIMLDIQLPDMNGMIWLKKARERYPALLCPVVVVSAQANKILIDEAGRDGISAFVTKPFDIYRMLSVVRSLLASDK